MQLMYQINMMLYNASKHCFSARETLGYCPRNTQRADTLTQIEIQLRLPRSKRMIGRLGLTVTVLTALVLPAAAFLQLLPHVSHTPPVRSRSLGADSALCRTVHR